MKSSTPFIITLALALLGAHYLRNSLFGMSAVFAVFIVLLFQRTAWLRFIFIAVLLLGALQWLNISVEMIQFRNALDQPWLRLAIILGSVFAFTLFTAAFLFSKGAKQFFNRTADNAGWQALIFILVTSGLMAAHTKAQIPLLLVERFFPGWGELEILLLGLYAAWLGGQMLIPGKAKILRPRIWALFSFFFFGQLLLGILGLEKMLMTGQLHLPIPALIAAGPVYRGGGFFMLILLSSTILLVGPAWCSHLCYIGAWDDVLSRRTVYKKHNKKVAWLSIWGRGATLLLVLCVALLLRQSGAAWSTSFVSASIFGIAGVAIMIWFSRKTGLMVHCTTFCPIGFITCAVSRLSPWRIRIQEQCSQCFACVPQCRYNALSATAMKQGRPGFSCTLCGDCISNCSRGHIHYAFPFLNNQSARALFIALVVSLHALFLGVARM